MYANHRHYILFILALVTFIVTTLGYAYMRNLVYRQANNSAELLAQVSDMEERKKREQDLSSFYSKNGEEQKRINNLIVTKDGVVDFIEDMEKIGTDTATDLTLSGIETGQVVKTAKIKDNFTSMKAKVNVVGPWSNVMRALTLIENMPYSISVGNIRLSEESSAVASTSRKLWVLNLDVKVLMMD